ncbi:Fe-S cluster assembly iron-binding protein IscA [Methanococcus voltae]|nr:Fe-S cluster assembly iron-binding protein IscA [Methanococcus voltae]MBP2172265.1 Fe-S cluster assembly iron-binding protein IscA [Methanococcus voltae]MBP2200779.1 Fe-S cluster assembly iron-binding protein IscA [Methanococcus voltae]MCS3921503.1 Fe-S cluster assembly iron-binding protein IscA [Methanococcus voltae PS]
MDTDELIHEEPEFKVYIDKMAKQVLESVNIVLKKSVFSGKYLAIQGAGGCC